MAGDTTNIPLGQSIWRRVDGQEPEIKVRNRYFESTPANTVDQVSFLARPGLDAWKQIGNGPIRATYCQPGSFDNDLFVVSDTVVFRIDNDQGTVTQVGSGLQAGTGKVQMAATSNIGSTPAYLFVADGRNLWVYDGTTFSAVVTPDDVGISDVCYTSDYVIVIPAQGQGINGRFFWINPGETTIDPLNFATAERSPDSIVQVIAVGDQFWLLGTNSTEVWYPTGDQAAPFQRVQGRLFDRGVWGGTAVQVKDAVILVSPDGRVYSIDSGPTPISTPAIEEQIRNAIRAQQNRLLGQ